MPITRSYQCPECFHRMTVVLNGDEWDAPAPSCEACDAHDMEQEFKPFAIGGSVQSRAVAITESIIANDYGVANFQRDKGIGSVPKVRYKDQTGPAAQGNWEGHRQVLEQAIAIGQGNRRQFGADGLDILKRSLADGSQPDLIEASKRRSIKVW